MTLSIRSIEEWPQIIAPPQRLVAMDIGAKTIGLALSTPDWQMALPLTTIRRTKWAEDLKALDKALTGYGIGAAVIGLPLLDDLHHHSYEGAQAQSIKQTTYNLIASDPKWIAAGGLIGFWDERLTTAMAEEIVQDHLTHKMAKSAGAVDAIAAQIILERVLDYLNHHMRKEKQHAE